jgi:hypothetical protein
MLIGHRGIFFIAAAIAVISVLTPWFDEAHARINKNQCIGLRL